MKKILNDKKEEMLQYEWKDYISILYWCVSYMYMELIFHIAIYGKVDSNILFPLTFAGLFGMIVSLVVSSIPLKAKKIISRVVLIMAELVFIGQFIYYKIFRVYFSISSITGAKDAANFSDILISVVFKNFYMVVLFMLPYIIFSIFKKYILHNIKIVSRRNLINIVLIILMLIMSASILANVNQREKYSPKQLFFKENILELSMQKLGVIVSSFKDVKAVVSGQNNNMGMEDPGSIENLNYMSKKDLEGISREPNIDKNVNLKDIYYNSNDYYFRVTTSKIGKVVPTYQNKYTGMFKGYNIVFVTAESLSKFAISKEVTPTLYKIFNEGFVFNNFYNPLWYHSTIDGEYVNCLSQYPSPSRWCLKKSADTYQPYALGNVMNSQGYKSYAYHDYSAAYYDRTKTHPNMGYEYKAIGNGLNIQEHDGDYSDFECMESVCDEFIDNDKFNVYFMSYSGHMPYETEKYSVEKNLNFVSSKLKDSGYSENVISYIACQKELDNALEYLIQRLDEKGILDKTLFIVAPDHFPYGLDISEYSELIGEDAARDNLEISKNGLGIWCSAMDKSVQVDKLCSSVDILPTVLNLMGIEYDSRFLAGKDILSDCEPLVIFSDKSFITDKVKYDASKDEVTYLVPKDEVSDGYVEEIINEVREKSYLSEEILNTDYYSVVYGDGTR